MQERNSRLKKRFGNHSARRLVVEEVGRNYLLPNLMSV